MTQRQINHKVDSITDDIVKRLKAQKRRAEIRAMVQKEVMKCIPHTKGDVLPAGLGAAVAGAVALLIAETALPVVGGAVVGAAAGTRLGNTEAVCRGVGRGLAWCANLFDRKEKKAQ